MEEVVIEALNVEEDNKDDSEGDNMNSSVDLYDANQQPQKQL